MMGYRGRLTFHPFSGKYSPSNSSVMRQRGESHNGGNKKMKHDFFFFLRFLVTSVSRFSLLPYCRRIVIFLKTPMKGFTLDDIADCIQLTLICWKSLTIFTKKLHLRCKLQNCLSLYNMLLTSKKH